MNAAQRMANARPVIERLDAAMAPIAEKWRSLVSSIHYRRHPDWEGIVDAAAEAVRIADLPYPKIHSNWIACHGIPERPHLKQPIIFAMVAADKRVRNRDDLLAWHIDQATRGGHPKQDVFHGPALLDPVLAAIARRSGWDERKIKWHISDAVDYPTSGKAELMIEIAGRRQLGAFSVVRNEVRLEVKLAPGVVWKGGYLILDKLDAPETVMVALRGKPLETLIDHPQTNGLGIAIKSIGRSAGKITVATSAADEGSLETIEAEVPKAA